MADAFARDFAPGTPGRGEVALDRAMHGDAFPGDARRTVRSALEAAFPEASRLDSAHIEAIVDGSGR
jgi:hypothetical protein